MTGAGSRQAITPELIAKIKKLHAQGLSFVVIGQRLGLNKRTMQQAMKREREQEAARAGHP